MKEKPALPDNYIMDRLREVYGVQIAQLEFLPIGADINAAKYRIVTKDAAVYFLKARKGSFEEISVGQ